MQRNYLKGAVGDAINTMLAAAGYNLKHWLNKVVFVLERIYEILIAEIFDYSIGFKSGKNFARDERILKIGVLAGLTKY